MTAPSEIDMVARQTCLILQSYRHWLGRDLLPDVPDADAVNALREAPFVVVSHDATVDPVLNYGNHAALSLWEMDWDHLIRTPSRLTAEPVARGERARLLAEVTLNGCIASYSGVRISRSGRRFRIVEATVWNLLNDSERPAGQAAMFDRWEFL